MLKKILIGATFISFAVSPCYQPLYQKYRSNIMDHNTCNQAEEAYRDETVKAEIPKEFWKIRANLAECYLDSAWLELSAKNDNDDNYLSIEQDCENSKRNLLAIPEKYQQRKEISDLITHYYFICNTVLENRKNREPEKRPFPGEVLYIKN